MTEEGQRMSEKELFYRNVMVDQDEELVVRVSKGYGVVVEVIIESDLVETTIRLSPGGAVALGKALADAGDVALRS
jgi:hypothetical protein